MDCTPMSAKRRVIIEGIWRWMFLTLSNPRACGEFGLHGGLQVLGVLNALPLPTPPQYPSRGHNYHQIQGMWFLMEVHGGV